jgi:hypothetical protein
VTLASRVSESSSSVHLEYEARLGISVETLKNQMDYIFRKLAVQSRHELTRRLLKCGVLGSDGRHPAGG